MNWRIRNGVARMLARLFGALGAQDKPAAEDSAGRCILCGRFVRCGFPCSHCGIKKL